MQDSLSTSDIRSLTKEQLGQFHKVRSRKSYILGNHQLYVRNRQKYIAKQLPIGLKFISTRSENGSVFCYNTGNGNNLYLFPLFGEPLTGVSFYRSGEKEIFQWVAKCGSIENALWDVLKTALRATEHSRVRDIIPECFRVYSGSVLYCYDSWMADSRNIVKDNPQELENHYFSDADLKEIQEQDEGRGYTSRKNSILFRAALYVLNLGTSQLKLRNYEYAGLTIKWSNINQRLKIFKGKYDELHLGNFLERILIDRESLTMEDMWKLVGPTKQTKQRHFRPSLQVRKKNSSTKLVSKNLDVSISHISRHNDSFSFATDTNSNTNSSFCMPLNDCTNLQPKKLLKLKSTHPKNRSNFTKSVMKEAQLSQPFNIKKRLTEYNIDVVLKLTAYLGLDQYLPSSQYETQILSAIENVDIKSNWVRKTYPNGSLYFGEIQNEDRNGKGLYLFQSDDFYYGDWKVNKIHGFGSYVFKNGEVYQGSFQEGRKRGHGSYRYADGRIFEGTWHNNCKVGLGTFKFPNQVFFLGTFSKNLTTDGLFINSQTGKQWAGNVEQYSWNPKESEKAKENIQLRRKSKLKHCRIERFSEFTTKQGSTYEGECLQGKKHGFGNLKSEKEIYAGEWKDDLEHGQGTLTVNQRFSISGKWSQGFMYEYHCDVKQQE